MSNENESLTAIELAKKHYPKNAAHIAQLLEMFHEQQTSVLQSKLETITKERDSWRKLAVETGQQLCDVALNLLIKK